MKVRDVLKMLEDDGWAIVRQRGSHRQLKHVVKPVSSPSPGSLVTSWRQAR